MKTFKIVFGYAFCMKEIILSVDSLCEILGVTTLSPRVIKVYEAQNPLIYRDLDSYEIQELTNLIENKISSETTNVAGPEFKDKWELNWKDNLSTYEIDQNYKQLVPKFITSSIFPLRFKGKYIMPLVEDFELKLVTIFREFLFENFFYNVSAVHEFGVGTGFNLIHLGEIYPDKKLYGYDWSDSAIRLTSLAGEKNNLKIYTSLFDMFEPNFDLEIEPNSGLLTVGAMEQLGKNWRNFLNFIINKRFSIYINIETNYEKNRMEDNDFNQIAARYIDRRNWLKGYFDELDLLERNNEIRIVYKSTLVGSKFHDSWSVTVWKLVNV